MTGNAELYDVVCILNGRMVVIPLSKAHELLWTLDIGWVLPTNFYRSKFSHPPEGFFLQSVGIDAAELEFGLAVHSVRCNPVTGRHVGNRELGGISRGAIVARRGRWGGKVYLPSMDPIECVPTVDESNRGATGYLLRRGTTWIVVLRPACPSAYFFDWAALHSRPGMTDPDMASILGTSYRIVAMQSFHRPEVIDDSSQ